MVPDRLAAGAGTSEASARVIAHVTAPFFPAAPARLRRPASAFIHGSVTRSLNTPLCQAHTDPGGLLFPSTRTWLWCGQHARGGDVPRALSQ